MATNLHKNQTGYTIKLEALKYNPATGNNDYWDITGYTTVQIELFKPDDSSFKVTATVVTSSPHFYAQYTHDATTASNLDTVGPWQARIVATKTNVEYTPGTVYQFYVDK